MLNEKVHIEESKIHGRGVYASQSFRKGDTTITIKGKPVSFHVNDASDSLVGEPNWIGVSRDLWIDPYPPAKFLNHSCDPNTGIKGKIHVVALRNIEKGEEITIDYSATEIDKFWTMKCKCGTPNCRKVLKAIQFLPAPVVRKYLPFVNTEFKKFYCKFNSYKFKLSR